MDLKSATSFERVNRIKYDPTTNVACEVLPTDDREICVFLNECFKHREDIQYLSSRLSLRERPGGKIEEGCDFEFVEVDEEKDGGDRSRSDSGCNSVEDGCLDLGTSDKCSTKGITIQSL